MTSPARPGKDQSSPQSQSGDYEWHVQVSRSGEPTVYVGDKALHSRFDPKKEALRAALTVPKEAAIVVLGGLGLGYVAEALLAEDDQRLLVIADADSETPARASAVRNIASLLSHPQVIILAGGSPKDVASYLRGGAAGALIHYLEWKPSAALQSTWYDELAATVAETSRRREINARTLERFGPIWVRNLAANAWVLPGAQSLEPWKDSFAGIPVLVLAGGPSLESVIPHLPLLSRSHLLIAVDTALPAVLRSGAVPDVAAAVDPQYWNTRHLDRCGKNTENMLVLAESATHPAVFHRLKGRPWLTRTRFPLGTLLEDAAEIKGELKAGGSVATAAWDLARHLGCSPMSIAGLDLGFPGGRTHYAGSLARELPLKSSSRINPAEDFFYHALHNAGARPVDAFGGGSILSDQRMDVYAAWFAESASALEDRSPSVVGKGGRVIPGMKTVDLEQLLKYPDRRNEIESLLAPIRRSVPIKKSIEALEKSVKDMLAALRNTEELSDRGRELAKKTRETIKGGENPASLLAQMEALDAAILQGEGKEIVSFLIQPIILEITSGGDNMDPLEVSERLYGEIAGSASYHQKYLNKIKLR